MLNLWHMLKIYIYKIYIEKNNYKLIFKFLIKLRETWICIDNVK